MVVPLNVLKRAAATGPSAGSGVTLSLLKRGAKGKVEVKTLVVPEEAMLARTARVKGEAESQKEKKEVKQLVLAAAATATRLREKEGGGGM
jgi:hypothetical protein